MNYELKTQNWRRRRPGVTLVEILIGLVLLSGVSFLIYSVFSAQLKLFFTQTTRIDVSSQNKIALAELTNQTRLAERIMAVCPTPTPCSGEQTTDNTLVYRLNALDTNGNTIENVFDYFVYQQSGTNLTRTIYKDPTSSRTAGTDIIATNLDDDGLNFEYNDSDPTLATQVYFTVVNSKTIGGGKNQQITQSAVATIRNSTSTASTPAPGPPSFYDAQCDIIFNTDEADVPSATQNGDIMILFMSGKNNIAGDNPPGWTQIGELNHPSAGMSSKVFWKEAYNEPESFKLYGFTSGVPHCWGIITVENANTITPIDAYSQRTNPLAQIITADPVTTTVPQTEIIFIAAEDVSGSDLDDFSSTSPVLDHIFERSTGWPTGRLESESLQVDVARGTKTGTGSTVPPGPITAPVNEDGDVYSNAHLIAVRLN